VKLVEEVAKAAQAAGHSGDRLGGRLELGGDLPDARAADQAVEDRLEEIRSMEPVGGPERRNAERSTAGVTFSTLDPVGRRLPGVEADLLVPP